MNGIHEKYNTLQQIVNEFVPFNLLGVALGTSYVSSEEYLGSCQTSMKMLFFGNSKPFLAVYYFQEKAPS